MRLPQGILAFWLILLLPVQKGWAALPSDAQTLEAEALAIEGAWSVKPHFPGYYDSHPSGGHFLAGVSKAAGSARGEFKIAEKGLHRLWIRYLDVESHPASFMVKVIQNDTLLAENEFHRTSLRATAEGRKKYGEGFARFVWQSLDFQADEGSVQIEMTKGSVHNGTVKGSRHLDLFLLTRDLSYVPKVQDLRPLYLKVRFLESQPEAAAIHVFGRRSEAPYYTPHLNINARGIHDGATAGLARRDFIRPGETSPWIEFQSYLSFRGADRIAFYTLTKYQKNDQKQAEFEILLSRTPDDSGIFRRILRQGGGCGLHVVFNLVQDKYLEDIQESRLDLQWAEATTGDGAPKVFPFFTGLSLTSWLHRPEVQENEVRTLRLLGVNGVGESDADFAYHRKSAYCFHLTKGKCLSRPDESALERHFSSLAKGTVKFHHLNLMDEPNFPLEHVKSCQTCQEGFARYLQEQGIEDVPGASFDKKEARAFYWTIRYKNHIVTNFLKTASRIAEKHLPGIPTTVNFATETVSGNMVRKGCDWFEIFSEGALGYGWHEDWVNNAGTYQVEGFQTDVLRAACRPAGIPFGVYDIMSRRSAWEIEAKAFAEIGHGNQAIHFFNYGPGYTTASDTCNHRPEIYQAIRDVTSKTAFVEDCLTTGNPAQADVAMLYSVTSDIWGTETDQVFGKERVYLHLLLRHCNYRVDILSEDDLDTKLDKYRVLFVADSHLRRKCLPALLEWVRRGGWLYLAAGALQGDEYDLPLELGMERQPCQSISKIGRPEHDWASLKREGELQGMPIVGGVQYPLAQRHSVGRGTIFASGVFAGVSYQAHSVRPDGGEHSARDYPQAHRDFISRLALPVAPRLTTDHHLVEANLIESPRGACIVLANWSGKPRPVTVTLDGKRFALDRLDAGGYIK
ncbi:MAG: hypothetical protein IJJ33_05635, partial [Victivallales bacterium]|nr:hypothetical protein [Victivallales bacterium]